MDEQTLIAIIVVLVVLLLLCMTGTKISVQGFEPAPYYGNSGDFYGTFKEGLANKESLKQLTGLHFDGFAVSNDKRNLALLRPRDSKEGLFSSYNIQPY